MRSFARSLGFTVAALVLGAGCSRPLSVSARVPNPLGLDKGERDELNYDLTIWIKDVRSPEGLGSAQTSAGASRLQARSMLPPVRVEGRHFPQSARLRASDAEVRFDLALTAEWRELVDVRSYRIELRDDRGVLIRPDDQWNASESHRDYETQYMVWKNYQTARIHDGSMSSSYVMWAPETQTTSQRVYRASTVMVFHGAVVRKDTRSLTLTLHSKQRTLRFTWNFL